MHEVLRRGPDRVLISSDGEATSSRRAREEHGVNPDVIFIRRDGWSLGAPKHLARVAYRLWADEWVLFIERPDTEERAIVEWNPLVS